MAESNTLGAGSNDIEPNISNMENESETMRDTRRYENGEGTSAHEVENEVRHSICL
jgi:hypothetical protein